MYSWKLNAKESDTIVVQPDISVICDQSGPDDAGATGAPDLVVEILSPSASRKDRFNKFNLYEGIGVREYWIVDPDCKIVTVHILNDGKYTASVYGNKSTMPVSVSDGCGIIFGDVFPE